ncbi:MAG: DUF493 domain-containing protein [Halothiobacillaceae bacterium]|nr:DUF493 domain-containing protein [Halothiobacillaceae bacterium]
MTEESPLVFPCRFPIKVMGPADETFEAEIVAIFRRHAPDLGEAAVSRRPSRTGQYVGLTVVVEARSREQLDALYCELTAHPRVSMCL